MTTANVIAPDFVEELRKSIHHEEHEGHEEKPINLFRFVLLESIVVY